MPTIGRFGPYRVFFYSNEGPKPLREPAHVHIARDDAEAKFWLEPAVKLGKSKKFPSHELRQLEALVVQHASEWRKFWNEFFGRS